MEQQHPMQQMHHLAEKIRGAGRNNDTMLVHMTPHEVYGLQALAQAHGGSLSINPHTGLPEAGFLSSILPTILGGLLSFIPGVGPLAAAGIVGLGTGAISGDIKKGLLAGLGAFGGASLGGALGAGNIFGSGSQAAAQAANAAGTDAATQAASQAVTGAEAFPLAASGAAPAATTAAQAAQAASPNFFTRFANAASVGGIPKAVTTTAAGLGLMNALNTPPNMNIPGQQDTFKYTGPYKQVHRTPYTYTLDNLLGGDTSERMWFDNVNPIPAVEPINPTTQTTTDMNNPITRLAYYMSNQNQTPGYAMGGPVMSVSPGSFVLDANTVSSIGNGSSNAGQEALAQMGGMPIQGPGTGTSDSVMGMVGPQGPLARFSRDEVVMPPQAVAQFGGGNHMLGTQRLQNLMGHSHRRNLNLPNESRIGINSL